MIDLLMDLVELTFTLLAFGVFLFLFSVANMVYEQ